MTMRDDDYESDTPAMLENGHGGDKQCLGRGIESVRAKRLIGSEETHQDCTSASDRPTDCVGGPIDAVLVEERGLLGGNGVFRWTHWSGHEGGLVGGMGTVRLISRALEFLRPGEAVLSDAATARRG